MAGKIIFYALNQKFLEREEDRPADAKQVMYYSLAIGHHLGVIDCLKAVVEWPTEHFAAWVERFPQGSEARRKFEGALRFGEITIDASHVKMLGAAMTQLESETAPEHQSAQAALMQAFAAIDAEPAMYLIGRRRDD